MYVYCTHMQITVDNLPNVVEFSVPSVAPIVRRQAETSNMSTNITIPPSIIRDALSTNDTIGVVFTYYSNSSLFPLNLTNREIPTPVIGASLTNESANFNLKEHAVMVFKLTVPVSLSTCVLGAKFSYRNQCSQLDSRDYLRIMEFFQWR